MSDSLQTTVICQDPGDGSGDIIIDLPPTILAAMDVGLGDSLSIELVDGSIVLKPIRGTDSES
ncbi:AbrB/MazE/SpoVT family DNA-binding domain-containing protein [Pseudomonas putida]|uniref:AbrB/MazE/SpoVT family DNA-binding domain-containing protein n=1 Tax=Pseudomonas putida TaxID=303 RepID=A0ABD7BKH0_PSEPU|nr:AbrB/MazE/SpoVT family DNA-binding domain-containing protein [Pseudomonas putida]QOD00828.1 AbrB/MazE/SpoVT family DNA-binding domain-containing protein [Pseudomonas putida]